MCTISKKVSGFHHGNKSTSRSTSSSYRSQSMRTIAQCFHYYRLPMLVYQFNHVFFLSSWKQTQRKVRLTLHPINQYCELLYSRARFPRKKIISTNCWLQLSSVQWETFAFRSDGKRGFCAKGVIHLLCSFMRPISVRK